jgi:hypothetical protein
MRKKLNKFKKLMDAGKMGYEDIRAAYQSWRGNFNRRFDAYHVVRHMDELYNNLFIFRRILWSTSQKKAVV